MVNRSVTRLGLLALAIATPMASAGFWSSNEKEEPKKAQNENYGADWSDYGVDVSFPMHHATVEDASTNPLGDRNTFYKEYLDSCRESFGAKGARCTSNELDRIAMTLRQPQSMQNYTSVGFKKIKAPEAVFSLIKTFWERNHEKTKPENWGVGNTYTNNWDAPTSMVSVEDNTLRGGGKTLKKQIWNAARDVIQEWTGEELTECSLYGIRIYHEGAVLAPHVDRLPLVSSAIINVAQDVDEPWPLEVYGHDGKATNVTMEPGDMVLYESHSVIHGRPFPLKGRFMANIFIHFEPTGHSLRHNAKMEAEKKDVQAKYRDATDRGFGGHENEAGGLPAYIVPGTPEEAHWRQQHPDGKRSKRNSFQTGSTTAHAAAQGGDLETLRKEVERRKDVIHAKDSNGWTPLHEGARGGHVEVVKYLIDNGADMNAKTSGNGGTALWWAKKHLGKDHPVVLLLEDLGALDVGPDL